MVLTMERASTYMWRGLRGGRRGDQGEGVVCVCVCVRACVCVCVCVSHLKLCSCEHMTLVPFAGSSSFRHYKGQVLATVREGNNSMTTGVN